MLYYTSPGPAGVVFFIDAKTADQCSAVIWKQPKGVLPKGVVHFGILVHTMVNIKGCNLSNLSHELLGNL